MFDRDKILSSRLTPLSMKGVIFEYQIWSSSEVSVLLASIWVRHTSNRSRSSSTKSPRLGWAAGAVLYRDRYLNDHISSTCQDMDESTYSRSKLEIVMKIRSLKWHPLEPSKLVKVPFGISSARHWRTTSRIRSKLESTIP